MTLSLKGTQPKASQGMRSIIIIIIIITAVAFLILGGHFSPEKKNSPSHPEIPNSPQTHSRHLGPSPSWRPPFWDFQLKINPPPPGASNSPFPLPEQEKKKSETSTKNCLLWSMLSSSVVLTAVIVLVVDAICRNGHDGCHPPVCILISITNPPLSLTTMVHDIIT